MDVQKIELIIEKGENGIWGRVNYNDNLIVEEADNLDTLQLNLKGLLKDFEGLEPESVVFDIRYDVYALFRQFDFLNISKVAKHAGIHPGLLRQYASGVKHPSLNQAKKIEETLHRLADEMQKASVYVS
ncbi:helix-turn-helix transcriptional regulator [Mucilaginibacter gotjawali]|uniref:Uncharacterized protein n=1 Tax=Mucilaginibacter gotjawali TaxID=1550579 RepID=A0A839S9Q6_9SPHI|nr:helix-turn-helix transcriptional regulator [Mucilaginibacter gotjawali]MBB3054861.1 hypothetical protein [Mucilaginibacter gotjawali]